jgi:hypothetical protein
MSAKDVKSFVINRKKWGKFELLNGEGKMCCLGFYGRACGATKDDMYAQGTMLRYEAAQSVQVAFDKVKDVAVQLANINDNLKMPDDLKEAHIAGIFDLYDIKVTFRGQK